MSPELLDPEKFNLKNGRQTRHSDCYALGMVIYEVLSGRAPFFRYHGYAVVVRIANGERPKRPQGEEGGWFTDDIWSTLERCWQPSPSDRPSIKLVLHHLEIVSRSSIPPEKMAGLPAMNPPTRDSIQSAEESTEESEGSFPSQSVSPQPSHRLPLKGNPNENDHFSPAHDFSALPGDAPGDHGLGTSAVDPNGSDPDEPVGILDKVSWAVAPNSLCY